MASINFGLLNTNLPAEIMQAPMQGYLGMKAIADQDAARKAQADQQAFQNNLALKQFGLQEQTAAAQQGAARLTNAKMQQDIFKTLMARVAANPTAKTAMATLEMIRNTTGQDVSQLSRELMQIGDDPNRIRTWAVGGVGDLKLMEPKYTDAGGTLENTNMFSPAPAIKKTLTPGESQWMDPNYRAFKIESDRAKAVNVNVGKSDLVQTDKGFVRVPQTLGAPAVPVVGPDGKPVLPKGMEKKQLPAAALKMQNDELEALSIASQMESQLQGFKKKIDSGELQLSPIGNLISKGRNVAGLSNENSRNFASFQATLEKLRNDSLRLNSGVQTEGDAQRAWNELLANINDPKVVSQRLEEIAMINKRAARLRELNIENLRKNFGADPLDTNEYKQPTAQPQVAKDKPVIGTKKGGYVYLGGDPANPSSWKAER